MNNKWNEHQMYEPFNGTALDIVPKIFEKQGFSFLSVPQMMHRKIEVYKSMDSKLIKTWYENDLLVKTPIFYDPKKRVAISYNDDKVMNLIGKISPELNFNPFNIYRGRMVLPKDFRICDDIAGLASITGFIFNEKDVFKYANKMLNENEAKKNIFLKAFVNYNQDLLDEFLELTYKYGQENYKKTNLLGILIDDVNDFNSMGLFVMQGINEYHSGYINGDYNLLKSSFLIRVRMQDIHKSGR